LLKVHSDLLPSRYPWRLFPNIMIDLRSILANTRISAQLMCFQVYVTVLSGEVLVVASKRLAVEPLAFTTRDGLHFMTP
jgi:hypothetical protein